LNLSDTVILRPIRTSHSTPSYQIRKDVPKLTVAEMHGVGESESSMRYMGGTETRQVCSEVMTRLIGILRKCKVTGPFSNSDRGT
jgi:hypothetical protein